MQPVSRALNYCRVFTEIAEALLHRMLESTKNNNGTVNASNLFGLLDLVLTCVGHHDYEVKPFSSIPFPYVYLSIFAMVSRLPRLPSAFGTNYLKTFTMQMMTIEQSSSSRILSDLLVLYAATVRWNRTM